MAGTIFDIVADETRRSILVLLRKSAVGEDADSGMSVSALVEALGVSQPTVSKHLKLLRDAGLVSVREVGQHRYYTLDAAPLNELASWVAPFVAVDVYTDAKEAVRRTGAAAKDAAEDVLGTETFTKVATTVGQIGADVSHAATTVADTVSEKVIEPVRRAWRHGRGQGTYR